MQLISDNHRALRVIQISDAHVAGNPDARYRGEDARQTLAAVISAAREWQPDILLATGDLSEDASPESYAALADTLTPLGIPLLTLPGNHDDAAEQSKWFSFCPVGAPLRVHAGGWDLILLDSTVPGEVPGQFTDCELEALQSLLDDAPERPKLVALHHHPVLTGSHWIDRFPLLEPDRFWQVLDQCEAVRIVTWGHVHHASESLCGSMSLLAAPSTVANSLPRMDRFTRDPSGPACRWLVLEEGGHFETGLVRP
jgi:Icc protein